MKAIRTTISALMLMLSMSSYAQTTDVCQIKRSVNNKTEYLGDVHYYVNGDTLFFDKQFSCCQVIYSSKKTGKMNTDGLPESIILKNKIKKGQWWYAVIKRTALLPSDYDVSAIVLRNYILPNEPKIHRCADAYLYNAANEIGRDKTLTPTKNIQKLLLRLK